jgi:hypothetical protein
MRHGRFARSTILLFCGATAAACGAESNIPPNETGGQATTGGVGQSSGGTISGGTSASGGVPSGGAATGGVPSGGTATGGTPATNGGTATSGGSPANGGSPAGGRSTGGASAGGRPTGGTSSGGSPATGGASTNGGSVSGGTLAGSCSGSCSNAAAGSCSAPQVRITSVSLGSALSYSTDETYAVPLAIAAKPGGGSRIAWVTGYSHYGSSTTSQVHVAELDCNDQLVGTPVTFQGHDFQDLAADANGGVVVLTRDGQAATDTQHCGDVNKLCGLPSDRPGCYDTYMVRFDCSGNEQWATKLTSTTASAPLYTSGSGYNYNYGVWWYQHHGRVAYDGTNYAAYFCDSITAANGSCVDIHEGDRMKVVGPTGSLLTGHDSFDLGCSHSWTTRMVWDPRTSHFVTVCATDNSCRIALAPNYQTIASGTCDGTLFGGDVVLASTTGYWTAWSQGGTIRLEHFTTGASDQTVSNAGSSQHPHLVSYGTGRMLLTWGSGSSMAAQVRDAGTGATIGSQFTIAVPDHPWQSFKAFPDGSAAWAGVSSASSTVQIARVLPCSG